MEQYYSDKELACPNGRYWWIIFDVYLWSGYPLLMFESMEQTLC